MALNDFGPKCIALVVDDTPDTLGMVSSALEDSGITVLVATNGPSAIELTRKVEPDVILMDAVMPGMSGFETCRELKFGSEPVTTPIVFMTGLTEKEHLLEGLASGGVDYITKPVIVEELLARLSTHIVNSRLLQSARDALDTSGRSVLACDRNGKVLWGSQNALAVLRESDAVFDSSWTAWVANCANRPVSSVQPFETRELTFQFVGMTAAAEILIKPMRSMTDSKDSVLASAFHLTPREAEVLYWLTLGKTNRDISIILGLSARTVNKHLEQVFQKMGIDNRTSAAVKADRVLNAL
ncbi:DNA-binding response regulator [Marivita geojedonensis]|uniref:Regulator n=1 Tax=Marivita geojedonensis TaxID=1123756 RepID=A0A1X4NKQ0_9RHOB|nr:DNA-binding response regulator [Marivita geojedonensis]OSQ50849.1 regulator [Marivita geojedonensis]PRY77468.1 LuxR family two component transcriptional regulator [Marivita geojedonensis]